MRKFFFLIVLLSFATGVFAQDIIVTTDGDVLKAYNIEIASNSVYFKTENKQNAAIQSLKKENIVVIKYANGTKKNFKGEGTTSVEETQQTVETPSTSTLGQVSEQSSQSNKAKINKINSAKAELSDKEIGKGNALKIFGTIRIADDSQTENDDVELGFYFGPNWDDEQSTNRYKCYNRQIFRVNVRNKTSKTLYLNVGNTFFTQNGVSSAFYVQEKSNTTSMSSGGEKSTGNSAQSAKSISYANAVVAVPPLGSVNLADQILFADVDVTGITLKGYDWAKHYFSYINLVCGSKRQRAGYECTYTENDTPAGFRFMLTYSDTENFRESTSITSSFYLGEILFLKDGGPGFYNQCVKPIHRFENEGVLGFFATPDYYSKDKPFPLK
jgi:hypothetical protein